MVRGSDSVCVCLGALMEARSEIKRNKRAVKEDSDWSEASLGLQFNCHVHQHPATIKRQTLRQYIIKKPTRCTSGGETNGARKEEESSQMSGDESDMLQLVFCNTIARKKPSQSKRQSHEKQNLLPCCRSGPEPSPLVSWAYEADSLFLSPPPLSFQISTDSRFVTHISYVQQMFGPWTSLTTDTDNESYWNIQQWHCLEFVL